MEKLLPDIMKIAEIISAKEEKVKRLSTFLKEIGRDTYLVKKIAPALPERIKVAAVDGGLGKKSLHGFDFMISKAVGVCFSYLEGKIENVNYYPSRFPTASPEIAEALSEIEWAHAVSLFRQNIEVQTARKSIETFSPDIILMDGLFIPYYADKPSRKSSIYTKYENLVTELKGLYEDILKGKTQLVGVIEDSRSSAFCNLIKESILSKVEHPAVPELMRILDKTRDTNLLFMILDKSERTMLFRYSKDPEEHPILSEFDEIASSIYSFYIKTAKWDRPIRVDFLCASGRDPEQIADSISSVILSISGQHSGYGIPAPLIEADNIAKITENELDSFYSHVISLTGNVSGIMKLRREQRPF